jgi:hypothetical protein
MRLPVRDTEVDIWAVAAETAPQRCLHRRSSPNESAIIDVVGDTARCQV